MSIPTPVEITIKGLTAQVQELKEIISRLDTHQLPSSSQLSEDKVVKQLVNENEKLKYRIVHLLKALDEKDREIERLRGQ
ncbi:uncharacterized protein VTP21DRAFT_7507 [Calcarisporiella thermophila]|uniref:uncharacterized protein n=1 Tax=Calcarisporiella thermophila TaxID=911321 RepID=UPI003743B8EA